MNLRTCAAALLLVVAATQRSAGEPASSYPDLVRQYAAGDRGAAVAGLQAFTEAQLAKELQAVRDEVARAARGRSSPPAPGGALPLRAAVMLHTDRDERDRRPVLATGERAPTCGPPAQAQLAETLVVLLLGDEQSRGFARRWYLAMALRSLEDTCFEEGRRWTAAGLKRFARDAELLLARGMLEEAAATLGGLRLPSPATLNLVERERLRQLEMRGRALLTDAGRSFEQALAEDPGLEEALLHLGRVRLRLDQLEPALTALQSLLARSQDPGRRYLAHLFLGRAHESAGRDLVAAREYRAALALVPSAQAAATALAHVSLMAGDPDASREVLDASLGHAGSRPEADPFWEYQLGAARVVESMLEALRDEATR